MRSVAHRTHPPLPAAPRHAIPTHLAPLGVGFVHSESQSGTLYTAGTRSRAERGGHSPRTMAHTTLIVHISEHTTKSPCHEQVTSAQTDRFHRSRAYASPPPKATIGSVLRPMLRPHPPPVLHESSPATQRVALTSCRPLSLQSHMREPHATCHTPVCAVDPLTLR